ncbi:oligosaccharide flippase family protein [Robertmurraya massiliosenegalensis]|uniref:putative polysaccharide biosynthesis protein n=1 Tax=Robertmurraya TaxID=2837507 RepID=UPI0039A71451
MQPAQQSKLLVRGAFVLAIAALLTKILSAVYRVPFQNIVGDTGFYIYQQVYPLYGVALVLATTGFPVIVSKLYTEQKNQLEKQRLMVISAVFFLVLGVVMFLLLYFGAESIARFMDDPELSLLIKVISVVFLIMPFTAIFRGYYQGKGNMVPTAYSQVGEQFVRVATILIAAVLFMRAGYSLYEVGAGAAFGSITGGIVGIIILITFIWVKKDYEIIRLKEIRRFFEFHEVMAVMKILLIQGFAICISSMLLLLMQLADSLNLYSLLISEGLNVEDAKGIKGIYDRGQPLIQLGTVVATSMSLSLVPLIASDRMKKSVEALQQHIQLAIRVSFVIGLGATVGLMTIMEPTNIMLFENRDGTEVLSIITMTILLSSIIMTLIAISQGLGDTICPAIAVIIGFVCKYSLNLIFVPAYGTIGAAWSSNIALALILLILFIRMRFKRRSSMRLLPMVLKGILAAVAMYIMLKGYLFLSDFMYPLGHPRLIASMQALSAVVIGALNYLFVIIRTNVFTIEELTLLPFGSKIMHLFPRKRNRR